LTLSMTKKTTLSDRDPKWNVKSSLLFVLVYTVVFAGVAAFVFRAFKNHSFIWQSDGIGQHIRILEFWGNLLRDFVKNPSQGLEMWSWNIGYGESTRTILNNIASVGDPFALLAVFFAPEKTELLYNITVILRFYFIGICFFVFCTQTGFSRVSSFAGCFCYAFCGFSLIAIVRHPAFSLSIMYLSLICAGIERYYKQKKPVLLIISTCLAAAGGYYFFFMVTVLVIVYTFARFFHYYKGKRIIKNFIAEILKISGLYSLGILMAGFFVLPTILYFFEGVRKDSLNPYVETMYAYSSYHYKVLFESFAMNVNGSSWGYFSFTLFSAFAVIAIIFMKKHRSFKFILAVFTMFYMIPAFGYILTGFTYASNRWIFGYAFVVAIITMLVLDEQKNWGERERKVALVMLIGYPAFTVVVFSTMTKRIMIYGLVAATTAACFFISDSYVVKMMRKGIQRVFERNFKITDKFFSLLEKRSTLVPVIIMVGILMNIGFTSNSLYNFSLGNYVSEFLEKDRYEDMKSNEIAGLLPEIEDDSFYRADRQNPGGIYELSIWNDSMVHNYRGTSIYLSGSRYMFDFNEAFNIPKYESSHHYMSLDGRVIPNALAGVKYFASPKSEEAYLPYGFKPYDDKGDNIILKSDFALPVGYAYDSFIKESDFELLSEVNRDDNMMQSVILPDSYVPSSGMKKASTVDTGSEIPCAVSFSENMEQEFDTNLSLVRGGFMEFVFSPGSGETYFEIKDINFPEDKYLTISFEIGDISKSFSLKDYTDNWRLKRENALINLGMLPQEEQTLKLTFSTSAPFSFSSMRIVNKDLSAFEKNVAERMENGLQNVESSRNKLSGTITTDSPKLLAFSIPANKGWSAKVNGKDASLIPANVSFFAIPIEAGENFVELSFETPGIKAGAVLSITTLITVICLSVILSVKKRKIS